MPTLTGVLFLVVASYLFVTSESKLFGLLLLSTIFEASSVFNVGDRGIPPYCLVAFFFIARVIIRKLRRRTRWMESKRLRPFMWFGVIGVTSAFLLPVIFAGLIVPNPQVAFDNVPYTALSLRATNLIQAFLLVVNLLVIWAAANSLVSKESAYKAYLCTFYVLACIIVAEAACYVVGIRFPRFLFETNPGYYMAGHLGGDAGLRFYGTFTEPSYAGAALVCFYSGFLADWFNGGRQIARLFLSVLALVIVTSTAALGTCFVATAAVLGLNPVIRFPRYLRKDRILKVSVVSVGVALGIGVVAFSPLKDILISYTLSKGDSDSFAMRALADAQALQLTVKTIAIGAGLGSVRPSSLITCLLSTVGATGLIAFGSMFLSLVRTVPRQTKWICWAIGALLFDMCLGLPDINLPFLWGAVALTFVLSKEEQGFRAKASQAIQERAEFERFPTQSPTRI